MGTVVHAGSGTAWWSPPAPPPSSAVSPLGLATASRRPSSRSGCAGSRCCWPGSPACLTRHLRRQPRAAPAADRRGAVLPGHRGRHHSAAAARGGVHQPRRRIPALAARKVLVKRLVCIEDLGNIEVLFTDKTGTLTEGRISSLRARRRRRRPRHGAAAGAAGNETPRPAAPRSAATRWTRPCGSRRAAARPDRWPATRLALLPFDHERRMISVLVADRDGDRLLVTKGAPETVLDRCVDVPPRRRAALAARVRRRQPRRRRRHPAGRRRGPR